MAKNDLKREPQNLDENVWWYEEIKGIELYIDTDFDPNKGSCHKYVIPWVLIRAALARKDK